MSKKDRSVTEAVTEDKIHDWTLTWPLPSFTLEEFKQINSTNIFLTKPLLFLNHFYYQIQNKTQCGGSVHLISTQLY